ncbi:MAG: MATE family efflux transporter [Planctomycetota bacterium]
MTSIRQEVSTLSRLAWPVVAAQLGFMSFALVDMAMLGRLGAREMGAVALAETILFGTMMIAIGLVHGIDPLVSQAHGAGDGAAAGRALQHGIVVALLASVPVALAWLHVDTLLALTDQSPDLAALGQSYATPQAWSVPFGLASIALRGYVQGRGIMMPPLYAILVTNLLNVFLNWVLIFGKLGMPAMGVEGAGIATAIARAAMLVVLALLVFGRGLHRGAWTPWSLKAFAIRPTLSIGVPVAVQLGLEAWAFNLSTQIAGRLGEATVAAHAVVLKLASFTFMVPLGISTAAATRVGNRIGAGDAPGAQHSAFVALGLGAGVMGVSALAFLLVPGVLASLLTTKQEVIAIALTIFPIAAAFQIFDGTQVVGGGILRGMGTPRPAAIFNLLGYFAVALPLGCTLAFRGHMGVRGVWIGLAAGLASVAVLLVAWIAYRGPLRKGSAASESAMSAVE